MTLTTTSIKGALTAVLAAAAFSAAAQAPAGYPADYQKIIDGARKEAKLVI